MKPDNILDISEVMDESLNLHTRILPKDGSEIGPTGHFFVLRESGQRHIEISYRQGVIHGPYLDYWLNQGICCEGQHHEGKQDGIWHYYNENGTIHAITQFKDGKVIDETQYLYDADGDLIKVVRSSDFKRPRSDGPSQQ